MSAIAAALGRFIGEAIRPILLEVLREFFQDKAEVAKPNAALQSELDRYVGTDGVPVFGGLPRDFYAPRDGGAGGETYTGSDTISPG